MAIKLVKQELCTAQGGLICTFVMDSADDFASLPKSCTGSKAIVAEKDGPIYMVNASGEWEEL